jgi:uroporphyrin-III C-methyltransferase/precorrin-2 dehydrogenase/sirohydrochlorin ferrochelatase
MPMPRLSRELPDPSGALSHFPVFFDLTNVPVLVLGSGDLAEAKARLVARSGARVIRWDRLAEGADLTPFRFIIAAPVGDEIDLAALRTAARAVRVPLNVADTPAFCDFILPAMIERGPVTVAVSTGGTAPILARLLRAVLEKAIPPGYGLLASLAGRWRERVTAALPEAPRRKAFWESMLSGPIADLALAGQAEAAEAAIAEALTSDQPTPSYPVALVGAGPGDPELLTLKAARLIGAADIILYDALVSDGVLRLAKREAKLIPVGKRCGDKSSMPQEAINQALLEAARTGGRVVRLKGGDPGVFGRASEEIAYLGAHGVSSELVPGVTAALGAAAALRCSLTQRGVARTLTLATAQTEDGMADHWAGLAKAGGTLALYMGKAAAGRLARDLIAAGLDPATPAVAVENASLPHQRESITNLAELPFALADGRFEGPTLLLIGAALAQTQDRVSSALEVAPAA